jgi:hypothetical protein
MSGAQTQPITTQTQTRDPWAASQPYLQQAMGSAAGMWQGNQGYTPYQGPTVAPIQPAMQAGLDMVQNVAQGQQGTYVPQLFGLMNQAANIAGAQGITPGIQSALGTVGQAGQQYQDIYNQNVGTQNPYLQDAINRQINQVNSAMSGAGRYGSGDYEAGIAQAIAPTLAQDYMARQQLAQQATGGLGQTGASAADIYGRGLSQAGQYAQMIPGLAQAQYLPAQMQMGAGDWLQNYQQQALQGQIAEYNAVEAYPWQQLQRANAIFGGTGALGGTQITAATPQQAPALQRLLGGALVGGGLGSAFGPVGTGVGALGGAGLGYFM